MKETKRARMSSLLKAMREIVIIVSSILLAFLLDAWWDLRQERGAVELLLSDLSGEYAAVVSDLQRYIDRNGQVIDAAESILDRIRGRTEAVRVPASSCPETPKRIQGKK